MDKKIVKTFSSFVYLKGTCEEKLLNNNTKVLLHKFFESLFIVYFLFFMGNQNSNEL